MTLRFLLSVILFVLPSAISAQSRLEIAESVFLSAQQLQTSAAGQALAQSALRIASGSEELSLLVRERQDNNDAAQAMSQRITKLAESKGAKVEKQMSALQLKLEATNQRIAFIESSLEKYFPKFQDLTKPKPIGVEALQAILKDDEAILMTYGDDENTYTWAVSKTSFDWSRAGIGEVELISIVKLLRLQLSGTGEIRGGISLKPTKVKRRSKIFGRQLAFEIYSKIYAPLEHVFGNSNHLMFIQSGAMESLPPAVLVTTPPTGDDDDPDALRETEWLIKKHALTTLPSVAAIRALRQIAKSDDQGQKKTRFVGFGDPLLGYRLDPSATDDDKSGEVTTRGVYEGLTEVANLAPLPNTSKELRELANTIGLENSQIFLGEHATEFQVKNTDLSDASVIAFATHGLLANGLPGLSEPALVFTPPNSPSQTDDALLTASEAASLKLSADLIILSACDTAGSDGTPGAEGLSGLARAFIYAGAQSILVSHWPVDDLAARRLTTAMLDGIYNKSVGGRAQSLRLAMLKLLNDESKVEFAHPSIWAPFIVVGEGG